jgi:hypothetical protein
MFIGLNSKRLRANTLGYVLPTHNPVRVAEEIATLDHILKGRLAVGFTRGYQARWFQNYAAVPGARATTPDLAKRHDEQDSINREIFEESVRIVKTAWTNDVFSYEGKYWTFPPKDLVQLHSAYLKSGWLRYRCTISRSYRGMPTAFLDSVRNKRSTSHRRYTNATSSSATRARIAGTCRMI